MLKRVNHTMKHMILFCSFAFMLFLTPRGIAITEQEWNEGCWDKTSRTIQLYEIRYGDNNEVISYRSEPWKAEFIFVQEKLTH